MTALAVDLDERLRRLALANEARFYRARVKRELGGPGDCADLIADPPPLLERMKVDELLLAIPGYGPTRVRSLMRRAIVSDCKTVGGLSGRQRDELVAALRLAAGHLTRIGRYL